MQKVPKAKIRLLLLANKAAPSPLLGQALGQYGINIMEFCKQFNNKTKNIKEHVYIPTTITIYSHTLFEIKIKIPTTSYWIKQITKMLKGSHMPKKEKPLGGEEITYEEIYHIGLFKKNDSILNHLKLHSLCKSIMGTIKSFGLAPAPWNVPKTGQVGTSQPKKLAGVPTN